MKDIYADWSKIETGQTYFGRVFGLTQIKIDWKFPPGELEPMIIRSWELNATHYTSEVSYAKRLLRF